jgi:hypothetical protein
LPGDTRPDTVGGHAIGGRDEDGAVRTVTIENPPRQKKSGPLVGVAERLGPRDTKCQNGCHLDIILNLID